MGNDKLEDDSTCSESEFPYLDTTTPLTCPLTGPSLLASPLYNKGSAFPPHERQTFHLTGLLPSSIHTLDEQVSRAWSQCQSCPDPLSKNTFLTSMRYQNLVLYYRLLEVHITELMSVVYTPTEGEAVEKYSRLFRRPEGVFLDGYEMSKENVEDILREVGGAGGVDYVVVTDGEGVLGIGDQGVGGVGIATAKLTLMTLCAGLHPNRTLPVVIDCGTNNKSLLEDELYLGVRKPRLRGEAYDEFIYNFVHTIKTLFPLAVLHFEDFGLLNARRILEKYRSVLSCFNDDIQGTGAVTLAAIYAACWASDIKLQDIRMVVFGAGTAGVGVADMVRDAIAHESGKDENEAAKQIWLVDKPGLIFSSTPDISSEQKRFARNPESWEGKDTSSLKGIIAKVKPHVLIGTSTVPGAFTEEIVKEMSRHVDRPVIFPLSNPTRLHEANPEDLNRWTGGKALIATGSPFPPVEHEGKMYEISECNNALIFPGIGLGAVLSRSTTISDKMIVSATKALASLSPALTDIDKGLLPNISTTKEISCKVAMAVVKTAVEEGSARVLGIPVGEEGALEGWVRRQMWGARYRELREVCVRDDGK